MRDGSSLSFSDRMLEWYDIHARELPWRVAPELTKLGKRSDPYSVWLSEIMLQQTTVAAVEDYFCKFMSLWPEVESLALAKDAGVMAAWAGLGYYARARNMLKCARIIVNEHGGRFPADRAELQKLPGVGPYTSAAIAAIAFDQPETVVDGNVERVMSRYFAVQKPVKLCKPELMAFAERLTPAKRAGDYAQAVMDLGAMICTPRNPECTRCPIEEGCVALDEGMTAELPLKVATPTKPIRKGVAYVAVKPDGSLLLEQRPENGLLGGMLGWPGGAWSDTGESSPPLQANWTTVPAEVRHTFTHFHLRLKVCYALIEADCVAEEGHFVPITEFSPDGLPTVMKKIFNLVRPELPAFE